MRAEPFQSAHRVSARDRAERLTLRAENREEQQQLAIVARLADRQDWWSEIVPELVRLEAQQPGAARTNGAMKHG